MENPEEVLQSLDEFAKLKPKDIPRELEEYLGYVAKTGDPVYQWSIVKCLFREKLLNVITDFYESCPTFELPPCPNVDPFNYEAMKRNLLERLDSFVNAPFTVQRLCELLTTPRKEYSRVDKFMRAIEKNILVVSTREPGSARRSDVMQPDFLMNGVMDGRSIDIGEAIETVSSDGVNLMHGDDSEVHLSDSDTIRIDCASAEEIDMDDHSEVDAPNDSVWEKEHETATSTPEECVKDNGEPDAENVSKINSEASHVEGESKGADSPDLEAEGFSETVKSECLNESVDSTTSESDIAEVSAELRSIPDLKDNKSDIVTEKGPVSVDDGPADPVPQLSTDYDAGDAVNEVPKAKSSGDILCPSTNVATLEESASESSTSEAQDRNTGNDEQKCRDDDSVVEQRESRAELDVRVSNVENVSLKISEVSSAILSDSVSKKEVNSVDPLSVEGTSRNVEIDVKQAMSSSSEVIEKDCVKRSSVVDPEPQERMEIDDDNQVVVVAQGDEPMDQSEQLSSES